MVKDKKSKLFFMKIIICWVKTFLRSLKVLPAHTICGHDWVDFEEHKNCKVIVSKCEVCGKIDIYWSHQGECDCKKQ